MDANLNGLYNVIHLLIMPMCRKRIGRIIAISSVLDAEVIKGAPLDYITGTGREMDVEYVMSNNFAFGGINISLIFKRV